jgi:hypothetical protein
LEDNEGGEMMRRFLVGIMLLFVVSGVCSGQDKPLTIEACRQFTSKLITAGNKSPDAFKHLFDAVTYRELLVLTIKTKACSDLDEEKANVYSAVQLSLETEQANRLQRFLIDQDLLKTFAALDQKTHRKGDN